MNKFKVGVALGGPTIILIFVVLSLTTLGALSLVTASGDWKLTRETAEAVTNYYIADGEAEEAIAAADASLRAGHPLEADTFYFKVSENQDLVLTLEEQRGILKVKSQKLMPRVHWDYEDYKIEFDDTLVE
ncbi:MAG: hypothetical protein ACOX5F_02170 [Anaerovoracaceae bacterium]|jgi:hypothetical protein